MEKLSSMDEQFLSMVNQIIEENIDNENFSVNNLAEKARLSRSMLHRKLKKLTGKSSIELITEIRLLKAKELLENNVATASEVAYMVGYSEPGYFYKVFKKYFHITPGEVRKKGVPKKLFKKRLNIIIPAFIIVLIPILFFIFRPFSNHQNEPEKTIAVLPFVDFSPEEGNEYIINGLMEEILDKLEKIGDLKVKSRTDVEKYKNTDRSTREIGRELNVNYLLEGSGQKISDKIKLSIQLIETSSGNHIFSNIFTEDIDDIFKLQEDVAFSIASELEAKLTTKEKVQIEGIPTDNLIAYNHYLRGLDYSNLYHSTAAISTAKESYQNRVKAQEQFEMAIKLDSSFVRPHLHLAEFYIYRVKYNTTPNLYYSLLDSGFVLLESALKYADNKADEMNRDKAWIFVLKGEYYLKKGMKELAFKYFEQHDEYISKQTDAYKVFVNKAMRYNYLEDYYNTLKNLMRYIRLKPDNEELPKYLLQTLSSSFRYAGYRQEAIKYAEKIIYLDGDSLSYYINLLDIEQSNGDFLSAQKYLEMAHRFNEDYDWCLFLLLGNSIVLRNYEMANKYVDEIENSYDILPYDVYTELFLGIAYLKNGMKEEAEKHLETLKNRLIQQIEFNLPEAQGYWSHFNLANIYSLLNEKEKALGYLKEVLKRESITQFVVTLLNESPFFDNIREEPEFQEILTRATEKYQRDHKRVGELLKDFGEIE